MTRLLLDTHAALWSLGDVQRLSPAARKTIGAGEMPAFISPASIYEIAIK